MQDWLKIISQTWKQRSDQGKFIIQKWAHTSVFGPQLIYINNFLQLQALEQVVHVLQIRGSDVWN